jgi:hypothetical protein
MWDTMLERMAQHWLCSSLHTAQEMEKGGQLVQALPLEESGLGTATPTL